MVYKTVQKVSETVDRAATALTVILLGAMTIITFTQIICRVFFTALSWSEEAARYLLVWLTFIGAGCVHKRAGHISISLLTGVIPKGPSKALQILAQILCILVFVAAIYYGFSYMQMMGTQRSAAMHIPMRYMYAAIPVGCILLLLHSVASISDICIKKEADNQ